MNIQCARCDHKAFALIGNTIQVVARHNSEYHVTTVSLAELNAMATKELGRQLLDKMGIPVLE